MILYDENDKESNSIDKESIRDWLDEQDDGNSYCPICMTTLVELNEKGTYYCPNDMCLDERIWVKDN